jgi:hypothetical protein
MKNQSGKVRVGWGTKYKLLSKEFSVVELYRGCATPSFYMPYRVARQAALKLALTSQLLFTYPWRHNIETPVFSPFSQQLALDIM